MVWDARCSFKGASIRPVTVLKVTVSPPLESLSPCLSGEIARAAERIDLVNNS